MPRKSAWPADSDAPVVQPVSQLSRADRAEFHSIASIPDREPDIPHAVAVLFNDGHAGWSPAQENRRPGACGICRGRFDVIPAHDDDRSSMVCGGCLASGWDDVAGAIVASLARRGKLPKPGAPGPWEDETRPKYGAIPRERIKKVSDGVKARREPLWLERPPLD